MQQDRFYSVVLQQEREAGREERKEGVRKRKERKTLWSLQLNSDGVIF